MEAIKVPRTVIDEKFKAKDGQIFDSRSECINHEIQLDFDAFKFDPEKIKKYSPENIQHFLYYFITQFQQPERRDITMLFVKKKNIWLGYGEDGKALGDRDETDLEFDNRVRTEILKCSEVDHQLRMYGSRNPELRRKLLKDDLSLMEWFQFLFGTGLITQDLLTEYLFEAYKPTTAGYYRIDAKEFNDKVEAHKKQKANFAKKAKGHFFRLAFERDSTEAWKYLWELNVFDESVFFNNHALQNNYLDKDFISGLVCGFSDRFFGRENKEYLIEWNEKRCRWLKFFLQLDLNCIKLWKQKRTLHSIYLRNQDKDSPLDVKTGNIGTLQHGYDTNDIIIYQSIEDVLLDASDIDGNQEQIEILKKFAGENVKKNNSVTICKPETKLATTVFRKIAAKFKNRKDLGKISINSELHELSIQYYDGFEGRYNYRNLIKRSRCVYFATSDTTQTYRGLSDVCALFDWNRGTYSEEKGILKLSDYIDNPDELFEIAATYLNDGMPLDMDTINKIRALEKQNRKNLKEIDKLKGKK